MSGNMGGQAQYPSVHSYHWIYVEICDWMGWIFGFRSLDFCFVRKYVLILVLNINKFRRNVKQIN